MSTSAAAFKANYVTSLFNCFFISCTPFLFSNGLCVALSPGRGAESFQVLNYGLLDTVQRDC